MLPTGNVTEACGQRGKTNWVGWTWTETMVWYQAAFVAASKTCGLASARGARPSSSRICCYSYLRGESDTDALAQFCI